ncbi:unnamed protein product, partial [Prorocentrum cordatum]
MARAVLGVGGLRSAEYPLIRAHVGRAFVEHVAETHSFSPWRPVSGALADVCEHGSGIVLCRLWPQRGGQGGESGDGAAARQCLRYLGVQSGRHVALAHPEMGACGSGAPAGSSAPATGRGARRCGRGASWSRWALRGRRAESWACSSASAPPAAALAPRASSASGRRRCRPRRPAA